MTTIKFTNRARRSFRKLNPKLRQRILTKIKWYASQSDPLQFADSISGAVGQIYRFRIGDYRVIFDWENEEIIITEVGPRDKVYRGK